MTVKQSPSRAAAIRRPGLRYNRTTMTWNQLVAGLAVASALTAGATAVQSPRTHRLEATPSTVAYGYYWSEAKPVLRIASGDIIDVDTLADQLAAGPRPRGRAGRQDSGIAQSRSSRRFRPAAPDAARAATS